MTKRVAYFDYVLKEGDDIVALTPNKVYKVSNEKDDSFVIKDDEGTPQFCLKGVKDCAHLAHLTTWVLLDKEETPKKPKWSGWIKNTTGKCPEGLKRKQKVKLKWTDGDEFVIDNPHDAAWYFSNGDNPVDITHYAVRLKDQLLDKQFKEETAKQNTDWQDNVLGKCPVPPKTRVEVVLQNGETLFGDVFNWGDTPMKGRNIVKWRLAD